MNGEQARKVLAIKDAIQDGSLTCAEMEGRLITAIEREWAKTDSPANVRLVSACQDLLWEIQTGGMTPYRSNIAANREAVMAKLMRYQKHRNIARVTARLCTTAAVILILAFVGDGLLNRGWLNSNSTNDGQQYVIQGQSVETDIIQKGTAAIENDPKDLTTTNLSDATTFLGFQPQMPTWLPVGWEAKYFYVSMGDGYSRFTASFAQSNGEKGTLLFEIRTYSDAENAFASFEQNEDGSQIALGDRNVYLTQNMEKTKYIWHDGLKVFTLTGSVEPDVMQNIIISIGGNISP